MSDYQWKSNEPVLKPPRPKVLLSDLQFIIFWAFTGAFGLAVGFFIGIGLVGGAPNEAIIAGAMAKRELLNQLRCRSGALGLYFEVVRESKPARLPWLQG